MTAHPGELGTKVAPQRRTVYLHAVERQTGSNQPFVTNTAAA